jgi:hypothetical protein
LRIGEPDREFHGEGGGAEGARAARHHVIHAVEHLGPVVDAGAFEHEAGAVGAVIRDPARLEVGQAEAFEPREVGGVVDVTQRVDLGEADAVGEAEGPGLGDAEGAQAGASMGA